MPAIGGQVVVDIDGYSGNLGALVSSEVTPTGLRVTLRGPLGMALQIGAHLLADSSNIRVTVK